MHSVGPCEARYYETVIQVLACALFAVVIGITHAEPARTEEGIPQIALDVKVISVPAGAKLNTLAENPTEKEKITTWSVPADELEHQIHLLLTETGATITSMPRVMTAANQKVKVETRQGGGDSFLGTRYVLLPRLQGNEMEIEIDVEHVSRVDQNARIHAVEKVRNGNSLLLGLRQPADGKSSFPLFMITPTWNGSGSDMKTRLGKIILPAVQFSGATLEEALEFFRIKSRIVCVGEESGRQGINLVLSAASVPATSIDLYLTNVPLIEALKYTAYLADLDLQVDDNAVVFRARVQNRTKHATLSMSKHEGKAEKKARRFIRPQVQFSGASVEEALEFLRFSYGCSEGMEDRRINFILKPGGKTASISLDLKDVTMWDAVKYIAEQAGCTVLADDYSIILAPN